LDGINHLLIAYWCLKIYRYHLKDVIIGKIYFLLVRIKIKNMDLEIRRRESTGSGANTHVETETLAKFELMDGAPVRGILLTTMLICTINKRFCIMAKIKYDPINLLYWDYQVR
jgi:hypothetical protein